jgi:hypothetical protein
MNDATLKTLMIHVERIVRPVRAMELRKLGMRREILSHLQAVLEEEMALCEDESAALEATLERLGDPAILTREIQKVVPLRERLNIWTASKGGWKTEQERRFMTGFFGMATWMQMGFVSTIVALTFGWWPLAVRHIKEGSLMPWESWKWRSLTLLALFLTLIIWGSIYMSFHAIDIGARPVDRRRLLKAGFLNLGLFFAYRVVWLLMGAGPWTDLLWTPLLSLPITASLAWLGRLLRPGIRDFGQWFELEIES